MKTAYQTLQSLASWVPYETNFNKIFTLFWFIFFEVHVILWNPLNVRKYISYESAFFYLENINLF